MPNLYELSTEVDQLTDLYNTVETDKELDEVLQKLLVVDESFEGKLESCCRIVKNMDADIAAFEVEEKLLSKRKKTAEARRDYLKRYMKDCMKIARRLKVKVGIFTPRVQVNSQPSVTYTDNVTPDFVADEFRVWNPPTAGFWSFDRDAIIQRWNMQQAWLTEWHQQNPNAEETPVIPEELRLPHGITVERGDHLRIG